MDDDATSGNVGGSNTVPAPVSGAQTLSASPSKHPRLMSLDCFRGLVIAWMIMSDEGGEPWTHWIDHSPWDGIHFADFVFPAFVFIVGMAIPLSTHKFALDRWGATRKAVWRAAKMFLVGFISASGGFPAAYGLDNIRIPGILQRIAFCYLMLVLIHIWVPVRPTPQGIKGYFYLYAKYSWQFLVTGCFVAVYFILTFGTNVPDADADSNVPGATCGYGKLDPACCASGYWDRVVLGLNHMYAHPTLNRLPECSSNSPGFEPILGRPPWCDRPYDPEGIVGSFTAVASGFGGLFFGYVLANETRHRSRIHQWLSLSSFCMALGLLLHFTGALPINKNLWSFSYVLVMIAVDGVVFSGFYYMVDVKGYKKMLWPLICMGTTHSDTPWKRRQRTRSADAPTQLQLTTEG